MSQYPVIPNDPCSLLREILHLAWPPQTTTQPKIFASNSGKQRIAQANYRRKGFYLYNDPQLSAGDIMIGNLSTVWPTPTAFSFKLLPFQSLTSDYAGELTIDWLTAVGSQGVYTEFFD